jgi:PmbA protein
LVNRSEIEGAAQKLLSLASGKAELLGADVMYVCAKAWSLSLLDGLPEENSCGLSGGISLRCLAKDGRQGIAVANDLSDSTLRELADWSYNNCLESEKDEGVSLYSGPVENDDGQLELFDESMEEKADSDFRMRVCSMMNEIARSRDGKVLSVRSASWSHGRAESYYAATSGISSWNRGTTASCGVSVVLRDGESYEIGGYGRLERFIRDLDPEAIARASVDRTLRILGGRPMPTGKYALLLEPEAAVSIMDEIGEMFCASEVHKGRSLMAGRLGEAVAGSAVTLLDDARMPRGIGTVAHDAECVPTGKTVLIDSGVACAYLYNLQHAAKDGVKSTGNAARGLSSLPDVATSNLVLRPGSESPESLMKNVKKGLLVTELMGLHTINSVTGDFSLGAKGVYIENGVPLEPVSGVTIADNLISFLRKITSVGNDLVFFGSTGSPTIVVEDVTIAGD